MASSDTEVDNLPGMEEMPLAATGRALSECADTKPASSEQGVRELLCEFKELSVPEEAPHLPDGVVRNISSYLTNESSSLLTLLAMCGTCRQWRSVAQELESDVCLSFDGYDNIFSQQPMVQRFRKLTPVAKEEVFTAAAKLFQGYSEASLSGDGATDRVLSSLSKRVGAGLKKFRLQNSSTATDLGLHALLHNCASLQHVHLEELSKAVSGDFLVDLFERCTKLQSVLVSGMPSLSWSPCKHSAHRWPELSITKLHVRGVNLDSEFGIILAKMPKLTELEIDGHARNITAAALSCCGLVRVSYQVASRSHLDEALAALVNLPALKTLELIVKNFTLCSDQLRVVGMLPLVELRLDSYIYKQQPTLSRSSYSHVDNDGVKALVDSICNRWCAMASDMQPLKLSLCGATALTHDAVSALLRLPILTELDIGGCCRIIAMDKMRLVAKVRAGREMLESGRKPSMRNSRFPGLFL